MKNGNDRGGFEDTIRDFAKKEPFAPFRIVMASGDKYRIDDPEMMVIAKSEIIYVVPKSDKVVFIRKSQISSLAQLHRKSAA
jgi:hypothetical protein